MRKRWGTLGLAAAVLGAFLAATATGQGPPAQPPGLAKAVAAQEHHTDELLARPGVVGTAVTVTAQGQAAVAVLVEREGVSGLPQGLDGVPVVLRVTGALRALHHRPGHGGGPGGGGRETIDPKSRFPRPVPIGVSTGNEGECSAGTIGARVKDGSGTVYALSNNHVYALENAAPIGSRVLQPGLADTSCALDPANVIGTLSAYVPIEFSTSASNTVDAALAASSTDALGNATPSNGYGAPKSATATEAVGLDVQKYGRSTSLTSGTITMINAAVNVGYGSGTARFVGQIVVESKKPFIKPGDSGSLLVTTERNPVGLLFAGNSSGKLAVANRIGDVLSALGVTVDGE